MLSGSCINDTDLFCHFSGVLFSNSQISVLKVPLTKRRAELFHELNFMNGMSPQIFHKQKVRDLRKTYVRMVAGNESAEKLFKTFKT